MGGEFREKKKMDKQAQCQTAAQDGSTWEKMLCAAAELLSPVVRAAAEQGSEGTGRSQKYEQQPNTERPESPSLMLQGFHETMTSPVTLFPTAGQSSAGRLALGAVFFPVGIGKSWETKARPASKGSHPSLSPASGGRPPHVGWRCTAHPSARARDGKGEEQAGTCDHQPAELPPASAERRDEQSL